MIVCAGAARAQETSGVRVPTEDDILAKTLSTDSPYFYRPMMMRYMEGDATLTDDHYYYLYYGYAYEADYDAHRELPGRASMSDILRRTENPTREEALAIAEAGRLNMTVDPFSPGNLNLMTWAYETAGDTLNARLSAARFRGVVKAITSSGTGAREKSPWHILRFSHADDVVAARGFTTVDRQVRSRTVEYIQVDRNRVGVKGFFFDYGRIYWKPYDGPRVERERNWLFNGYPI